jgi:hypothetical protein
MEAIMSGKYSAEWWETFARINQNAPRREASTVVDHLIQVTASGKSSFPEKTETPVTRDPKKVPHSS